MLILIQELLLLLEESFGFGEALLLQVGYFGAEVGQLVQELLVVHCWLWRESGLRGLLCGSLEGAAGESVVGL